MKFFFFKIFFWKIFRFFFFSIFFQFFWTFFPFLKVLKVRRPGKKKSGFWTVRILKICRNSGPDVMSGWALLGLSNLAESFTTKQSNAVCKIPKNCHSENLASVYTTYTTQRKDEEIDRLWQPYLQVSENILADMDASGNQFACPLDRSLCKY